MIFFLHIPNENALIHSGRDNKARVGSPAQVEHVLRVAHEPALGGPAHDAVGAVDGEAVLAALPDGDAFVIGPRGQESAVGGVAHDVGVFVSLEQPIEDADVFLVGVDRLPVVDDLPELNAPLSPLPLLLHKSLFVRTRTHELILERVKVDRENAILRPVPPHFR